MYRFSRAIYLELRSLITGADEASTVENRKRMLAACELALSDLGRGHAPADRVKVLFREISPAFPVREHERVFHTIKTYIAAAEQRIERERIQHE